MHTYIVYTELRARKRFAKLLCTKAKILVSQLCLFHVVALISLGSSSASFIFL